MPRVKCHVSSATCRAPRVKCHKCHVSHLCGGEEAGDKRLEYLPFKKHVTNHWQRPNIKHMQESSSDRSNGRLSDWEGYDEGLWGSVYRNRGGPCHITIMSKHDHYRICLCKWPWYVALTYGSSTLSMKNWSGAGAGGRAVRRFHPTNVRLHEVSTSDRT